MSCLLRLSGFDGRDGVTGTLFSVFVFETCGVRERGLLCFLGLFKSC